MHRLNVEEREFVRGKERSLSGSVNTRNQPGPALRKVMK